MPKGVEHVKVAVSADFYVEVQKPLMPKGVEHESFADDSDQVVRVQKPLMPKGVEHFDCGRIVVAVLPCKNL